MQIYKKPHNKMQIVSQVSNTAQRDDERADGVSGSLCAVAGKFHWPSYFIRRTRRGTLLNRRSQKASPQTQMQLMKAKDAS